MTRPSNDLLTWLRNLTQKKGITPAALALSIDRPRSRVRNVLSGVDDMTVDELLLISNTLELSPADLGLATGDAVEGEAELPQSALPESADGMWGNHPARLVKVGFELGCDFLVFVKVDQLENSGVPPYVLKDYDQTGLPVRLDAAYHQYNEPEYTEEALVLSLSFDALYRCTFPWRAIFQVRFFPDLPVVATSGDDPPGSGDRDSSGSHLRLVT